MDWRSLKPTLYSAKEIVLDLWGVLDYVAVVRKIINILLFERQIISTVDT
jgi:hypothetical protein